MAFRVEITDLAVADAEDYTLFIRDVNKEPEAAERWFRGLLVKIFSLERHPDRCPVVPEYHDLGAKVRHLLYFSHRIVFTVDHDANVVTIHRIYHGARRQLRRGGITGARNDVDEK